jgi:hypothetical protein
MNQTTTGQSEAHPANVLMALIVTLLAPTFLGVTGGDVTLARMAAIHTINDYRARNHADLIAIAQIIAFGLAALGSLSLSMDDGISLSMTLRLRGNAVALNRSAEQNRRVLQQPIRDNPTQYYAEPTAEPAAEPKAEHDDPPQEFLSPAAAQFMAEEAEARLRTPPEQIRTTTPATADERHQQMSAIARVNEPPASPISRQPPEPPRSAAPPMNR